MHKIGLIIKREYLTRIRNKTFIYSTLLTPLLFIGIFGISIFVNSDNSDDLKIAVYDESGQIATNLKDSKNLHYTTVGKAIYDSFAAKNPVEAFNGLLYVPAFEINKPQGIQYISDKQLGLFSEAMLIDDINEVIERERMVLANIDTAALASIKANEASLTVKIIDGENEKTGNAGAATAIGFACGLLIYLMTFIYGAMVMRGVMEEKISRIAEVMVSSVKPVQLMMGKIIGIGAVGITQFLIWIILMLVGITVLAGFLNPADAQVAQEQLQSQPGVAGAFMKLQEVTGDINIPFLIGSFLFYFIGGYLFYAALFAAVGSAVNEDPQDAQSMMFPITIPIIFSFIIMAKVIGNPTGGLAVVCSIIPFTSPIVMMARLPFGIGQTVDYWEFIASVVCLIGGFMFTSWLSAKIYRTGILMYGKKPSWKEMLKWAFRK